MLNLTPHAITIALPDGGSVAYPPSGQVARVTMSDMDAGYLDGVPVIKRTPDGVQGLPDDGQPCLVSSMVLSAIPAGTPGVYAPDTGPTAVRNDMGHIVAVTRLVAA